MTPADFLAKYDKTIGLEVVEYARKNGIESKYIPDLRSDMVGSLFVKLSESNVLSNLVGKNEAYQKNYLKTAIRTIFIDSWRNDLVVWFPPDKNKEIASISDIPEEFLTSKAEKPVKEDRGGCSRFSEDPAHGPFPGLEDMEANDQAVIMRFVNTSAEDKTRRTTRRLVDSILKKYGIDSSGIHDYAARKRSERS